MGKFNNLPKEIMLEVLIRLPTETVLECKLVCKPWRDVVRHPSFAQLHLNHLHSAAEDSGELGFIFYGPKPKKVKEICNPDNSKDEFYYSEYDIEKPFDTKTRIDLNLPLKDYSFAGSCNGLICFRSRHMTGYGPVCICNPVTREYIILPDTQGAYIRCGFGYCPSTNEYKVVRIRSSKGNQVVQVYTLGSGNGWRTVANTDIKFQFGALSAGAFANGALHWAAHKSRTILAYHLADEKCSEVPYPPCLTEGTRYLRVLGDFLSVTCYRDSSACEIWLLKKNKDNNNDLRWSKEFSFESYIPRPFGFTKNGMLLCYKNYKLLGYDLKASSAKMEACFGKPITEAIPHTNTLVSLKEVGEQDVKTMESSGSASASEVTKSLALESSI